MRVFRHVSNRYLSLLQRVIALGWFLATVLVPAEPGRLQVQGCASLGRDAAENASSVSDGRVELHRSLVRWQ